MERLTFEENIGLSIDKGNDCPSCYVCWACDKKVKKCPYFKDAIKKLKHYEDMEEQGKLLILPCKPGDTVYVISNYSNRINNYEIIKATVFNVRVKDDCKKVSFTCRGKWKNRNPYIGNFTSNSVSKTVFLTEHEAQEALEKMKGE